MFPKMKPNLNFMYGVVSSRCCWSCSFSIAVVHVQMSKYKRTSTRGSWSEASMGEAIEKVQNKELSLNEASKVYNLSKATLFRRVAGRNKVAKGSRKHLGRFEATFDADFENELERYIIDMEARD